MKRALPILLFLFACDPQPVETTTSIVEESAKRFFDFYKTRDNWEGFQDLYADDMVFEDVIFRFTYNKKEFIDFYNWPDSLLSKHPDYPEVLVLQDLALTDSSAVGRGYFTPFYYDGRLHDDWRNMQFTMWLYFNQEGKITKHIDWIEYPPDFLKQAGESLLAEEKN